MSDGVITPQIKTLMGHNSSGSHEIVYSDWIPIHQTAQYPLLCVHGLTRNGQDFDHLARYLCEKGYRVICPDMVGRHRSSYIKESADYDLTIYKQDIKRLLKHEKIDDKIDWLGTSMGGLIAMSVMMEGDEIAINRLVLNDIGPYLPLSAMQAISDSVEGHYHFPDYDTANDYLRKAYASFGIQDEAHWQHIIQISLKALENGGYERNFDYRIFDNFRKMGKEGATEGENTEGKNKAGDLDFRPFWPLINVPVLIIRGENSELLPADIADYMVKFAVNEAQLLTIKDCGHAPALMEKSQITAIYDWLEGN